METAASEVRFQEANGKDGHRKLSFAVNFFSLFPVPWRKIIKVYRQDRRRLL